MTNPLAPQASPQVLKRTLGIRRLNDRPLYIILIALALLVFTVVLVATHRAQHQAKSNDSTAQGGSTWQMAQDIVAGQEEGFIAAEQAPAVTPTTTTAPTTVTALHEQPPEETVTSADTNETETTTLTPQQEEQLRIHQAKVQQFEQALASKIAVPLAEGPRVTAVAADANEPLNPARPEATTVYQQRGTGLTQQPKAATAGSGSFGLAAAPTNSGQNLQAFNATDAADRWALPTTVTPPRSPYELRAGAIIPAIMISGINSDLPGQVIAQISQPVYDTATGKYLLLPQGTRLIGSYANDVAYGQERVFMAWQRLVFPDGKALDIGAMPGADAAGYAGFSDQVNHHYWRVFGSAFLMSGITAGLSLSQGSQEGHGQGNNTNKKRINDVLTEALGQQLGAVITKMIEKNLNIAPTLEIRPGYRFNVMVVKDMAFTKPYQPFDYTKTPGEPR